MSRVALAAAEIGVRHVLREATREVHERLHRHPSFAALVDGTLTRSRYRGLLMRLSGVHRPLEDALLWRRARGGSISNLSRAVARTD